ASGKSSAMPVAIARAPSRFGFEREPPPGQGDPDSPPWVNSTRVAARTHTVRAAPCAVAGAARAPAAAAAHPGTITLAGDERSPRARPSFRVMAATKYEFRIRGRLSEPLLARFEMLESEVERVETVLHGPIR